MKKVFTIFLLVMFIFPCLSSFTPVSHWAGDVDGDGELTAEDARLALRASVCLEQYKPGEYAFAAADVNSDGTIGSDDARSILRSVVGLETPSGMVVRSPVGGRDPNDPQKEGVVRVVATLPPFTIVPIGTTATGGEYSCLPPATQYGDETWPPPSTDHSGGQPATLPPEEPTTPVPAPPAGVNEFSFLQGGSFYLQGTMTDSSGQALPLEMAVTPNSVYMLSNFEGAEMGMLINDGSAYMIYPDEESYLELSSAVLKAMGMKTDDLLLNIDLNYSQYDLSKADSTAAEKLNDEDCTVYIFNNASGSTRFYLNGNKLVRFANYDANGNPDTVNDISYIIDQVPADKINPPSDYKKYSGLTGMFSFISLLSDVVGEE